MNAENNSCLSVRKGYSPDFRNNLNDSLATIQCTYACMYSFHAKKLNIQTIKSDIDDYENRGGK